MSLSGKIAFRYLFSKKSHSAINIISMVSVSGVAIATMALVCTLSVFNGFQNLVASLFCSFDPELKVSVVEGKTFNANNPKIDAVRKMPEIAVFSEIVEDNALVRYKDRQVTATLMGVSDNFSKLTHIDSILYDGKFVLADNLVSYATVGAGLSLSLGVGANFVEPLEIYAPKREGKISMANPASAFNTDYAYVTAIFSVNQAKYDESTIIVPISLARKLFQYSNEVTAVELKLKPNSDIDDLKSKISRILGSDFKVSDRYEQQEEAFKMMKIEKWMTFLILCFVLMIATFNIIGTLSMLIIEKKADITTLRSLGADNQLISKIFLFEGWLISAIGAMVGIVLGLLLCVAQENFGLLRMGGNMGAFVVDAYPVKVVWTDLITILGVVFTIGFLSAWYPVRSLKNKYLSDIKQNS
jgi:ABC-type transport system, involved in lipoprotein release, permease component